MIETNKTPQCASIENGGIRALSAVKEDEDVQITKIEIEPIHPRFNP